MTSTSQNTSDLNVVMHWTQVLSAATVSDVMAGYARPLWMGGREVSVPDVAGAIGLKNSSKLGGSPYFNNGYSMNALAGGEQHAAVGQRQRRANQWDETAAPDPAFDEVFVLISAAASLKTKFVADRLVATNALAP